MSGTDREATGALPRPGEDGAAAADRRDSRLERAIGLVLRAGVIVSTVCLAIGLLLEVAGARAASSVLLNVGLVVLLATPVGRVVTSVFEYAAAREWTFVILTLVVLGELFGSLLAAIR